MIPDPLDRPTIPIEEAARIVGIGRSAAYDQAKRWIDTDGAEGLPAIRYGRRLVVPTQALLEQLHIRSPLAS